MTSLVLQGSAGCANFTLFAFSAIFLAENQIFVAVPGHSLFGSMLKSSYRQRIHFLEVCLFSKCEVRVWMDRVPCYKRSRPAQAARPPPLASPPPAPPSRLPQISFSENGQGEHLKLREGIFFQTHFTKSSYLVLLYQFILFFCPK